MQLGVGPLLLLDRSPTALVEHGQGRHLCHLQDCRTSRDREDSLPGEQILSKMTEKHKKISGSVVESSSHSGWFTVLRLPVPICPGYQFPWSLSVSLLLIVCFCFCCFLCYLLSLRCVSVLTFACGGALATYSRFTMIVTSEEESDRGDKKSSREWKKNRNKLAKLDFDMVFIEKENKWIFFGRMLLMYVPSIENQLQI